ncbi:uncharacterized protein GIQ15_00366 [Arthroderma uncinatum]|uniref:uncharacterized protein n=1 Tax=Arthroderma uncinatum TaxID=74035 RepID=UPI00144AC96F|nr:uncharacterized protein GIQ15_00366 [Arthroderma uncinatum]KAF3490849.1 hypothetical protein GIQ15_00366 [Arthroderma uncinatum]
MSHRSIEQALAGLLPALAEELPRELVNLASSLLTQSRSSGASLKPEMEIARPYACAEIACKRLSRMLTLPSPLSRPPCPPRVYKKLYSYLEQSLLSSSASSKRQGAESQPPKRTSARIHSKAAAAPPALPTPTATSSAISSPGQAKKPNSQRNVASNLMMRNASSKEVPQWAMGSIRTICKTIPTLKLADKIASCDTFAMALPPHIYSGLCSVISLISPSEAHLTEKWKDLVAPVLSYGKTGNDPAEQKAARDRISTLIIAIYFIVYTRRLGMEYDGEKQNYPNEPIAEMNEMHLEETVGNALDSINLPRAVDGQEIFQMEVHEWLMIILDMGWAIDQQWFENVPLPTAQEIEAQRRDIKGRKRVLGDESDLEDDDEIMSPRRKMQRSREADVGRRLLNAEDQYAYGNTLLPGLGTMMHPQVDWLSEDKKHTFGTWRDRIMAWIEQIEIA